MILSSPFRLLIWEILAIQASCQSSQTYYAILVMHLTVIASIWIPISLIAFTTAHPTCSLIYGRPNASHCGRILSLFTSGRAERGAVHCFAPAAMEKPDDVSTPQWVNRVNIPKFWTRGKFHGTALWPY